jgi:NTP pyrophosphatase (non-canonical NTP hydrolase)
MDLSIIQEVAVADSKRWFGNYDHFDMPYFVMAMAGEAGEACNVAKKILRDGHTDQAMEDLKFEIVDTFIYCLLAAEHLNFDLEHYYGRKRERNEGRFGNVA